MVMNSKIKNNRKIINIIAIISFLSFSFMIYFATFNTYVKSVSVKHTKSAESTNEMIALLNDSASQLLSNGDIIFVTNTNNDYDVFKTDKAIYITKTFSALLNAESIYFWKKQEGLIFVGNRMVAESIDDYAWMSDEERQTVTLATESEENYLFSTPKTTYYICNNDKNTAVLYRFKQENINKQIFDGVQQTSIYYKGKFICNNMGDDIHADLNPEKTYAANVIFRGFQMYICNTFDYLTYATRISYKELFAALITESAYEIFIIIIIYLFLFFLIKYILRKINTNIVENEKYFFQEISEKAILHLFLNRALTKEEVSIINKLGKMSFTPVIIYVSSAQGYKDNEMMVANYAVNNVMGEMFEKSKMICYSNSVTVGIIADTAPEKIADTFRRASKLLNDKINITASLCIGKTYISADSLIDEMNQNGLMIDNVFLQSNQRIVYITDNLSSEAWNKKAQMIYNNILSGIKRNNRRIIEDNLSEICTVGSRYKVNVVRSFVVRLFLDILEIMDKRGSDILYYEKISEFFSCQTVEESIAYILDVLDSPSVVTDSVDDFFKRKVESVISLQYNDLDFNLSALASILNMNKTYVGRKFITIFDKNFTQYMAEYRVNKACIMLKNTTKKIEDIGKACGFGSASYFIRIFKTYKGITPLEYRTMEEEEND